WQPNAAMGHFRQIGTLPAVTACPLRPPKRTNAGLLRYVRFLPIGLQKSCLGGPPQVTRGHIHLGERTPKRGRTKPAEPWRHSVHRAQLQRDCHHLAARAVSPSTTPTRWTWQQNGGHPDGLQ